MMYGKCTDVIEYHDRKDLTVKIIRKSCALDCWSLSESKTRLNSKTRYYDHRV